MNEQIKPEAKSADRVAKSGAKMAETTDGHDELPIADETPWAKFMTDDEYYPYLIKENIRPAMWRWDELKPRLDEVAKDPLRRADRRFVTLVHDDTGEAGGALPSVFIGIQIFNPGEHIVPHRHSSYAIYHIVQGTGYSVLDGEKFEWKAGDTLVCPPMASHEHVNDGDEVAIQYVVQDMPARAMERNLIWEEPIGRVFHMVKGEHAPHKD